MQTKYVILSGVLILAAAAGMVHSTHGKTAIAPASPAATPVDDRRLVVAPGLVEPMSEEVKIGSELDGKLRQVMVDEGDRVARGQVIAVLENADYAARVELAQADLAARLKRIEGQVFEFIQMAEREKPVTHVPRHRPLPACAYLQSAKIG